MRAVRTPCITSQFQPRKAEDRPLVVPNGPRNFAFLRQYTEIPEDVVFAVEYSVRGAMHAVYQLSASTTISRTYTTPWPAPKPRPVRSGRRPEARLWRRGQPEGEAAARLAKLLPGGGMGDLPDDLLRLRPRAVAPDGGGARSLTMKLGWNEVPGRPAGHE
jgi:hypothetical protein